MNEKAHIVGDLISWGYQPLAVAGDTKRPVHSGWPTLRFSEEEILRTKATKYALRMGDQGLQAIDVDIKNADDPQLFLSQFKEACAAAELPWDKIIGQTTLSGGVHLIYRAGNPKGSKPFVFNEAGKCIIESRGIGACVIIYEPEKFAKLETLPMLSEEEEQLLWSVALSFDQTKPTAKGGNYGEYNTSTSCLDILMRHGWTVVGESERWFEVLRDGNPTSSSSGKVFKETNRAYIWSTSTSLPAGETLTPSALSCYLDYGGNWTSFGRALNGGKWTQTETTPLRNIFNLTSPNLTVQLPEDKLPKPLLGPLWQEGELTVLFGPTNTGKSVLAVDLADAIANGAGLFDGLLPTASPKRVLYVDFELSEAQFAIRYRGREFSQNLVRATPDYDFIDVKDFRNAVVRDMKAMVKEFGAEVLIVDNLSNVNPDNTQALDAAMLVQDFKKMKGELGISIMLIGHTPKLLPGSPIELLHLAGSAQLSNFLDSCFALNRASGSNVYIKQLKQRNDRQHFGSDNVILGRVEKETFVTFSFVGLSSESELLSERVDFAARDTQIREDYATGKYSQRQLAGKYGVSKSRIHEILNAGARPVE